MQSACNFNVIIVAAGSGKRLGNALPKQYIKLHGVSILQHTLNAFAGIDGLEKICIVVNPEHKEHYQDTLVGHDNVIVTSGGAERKDSVYNGLKALSQVEEDGIVLVHDAARPFVQSVDIKAILDVMKDYKAATLASPVVDTLRYADQDAVAGESTSRDNLWAIQTPQAFHYGVLKNAHESGGAGDYTDDTQLVSDLGTPVKFVKGSKRNFKITLAEDLELAEKMLSQTMHHQTRMGQGFDVHAFDDEKEAKAVRLCGVDIEHNRPLKGHSDADVGLHALTDAILGAIGEGDIGLHFPPSNNDFKDMDSAIFLEHAMKLLHDKGGELVNADITLVCEKPKIGKYREAIIARVAQILNVSESCINIKATTTEKLGFTGREEGIAAQAAVSVSMPKG